MIFAQIGCVFFFSRGASRPNSLWKALPRSPKTRDTQNNNNKKKASDSETWHNAGVIQVPAFVTSKHTDTKKDRDKKIFMSEILRHEMWKRSATRA